VGESGRLDLAAVGAAAAIRDEVDAELTLRGHRDRAGDAVTLPGVGAPSPSRSAQPSNTSLLREQSPGHDTAHSAGDGRTVVPQAWHGAARTPVTVPEPAVPVPP